MGIDTTLNPNLRHLIFPENAQVVPALLIDKSNIRGKKHEKNKMYFIKKKKL